MQTLLKTPEPPYSRLSSLQSAQTATMVLVTPAKQILAFASKQHWFLGFEAVRTLKYLRQAGRKTRK